MFKEPILKNIEEGQGNGNEILSNFSSEQQDEIEKKRKILSSLAFFIGKDFEIPVELNTPGKGWHWDFKNNVIRIDPVDLLEKSMDYLRFVISHEGGHRRISRTDFIPEDIWIQPGFSFMMNSIEDPRDNNFVADSYPKFREQMELAYKKDIDAEEKHKAEAKKKLGYTPRFMQAGFEYIKQWFREASGDKFEISDDLPDDVRGVIEKTLIQARDSWLTYPSKEMTEGREFEKIGAKNITGEELIKEYACVSYEMNLNKIWPEYKKLIESDKQDEKMQEFMKDMQQEKGEKSGDGQEMPQDLKDKLSSEEQKELEEAIHKAIKKAKESSSEAEENSDSDKSDKKGGQEGGQEGQGGGQGGQESQEGGQEGGQESQEGGQEGGQGAQKEKEGQRGEKSDEVKLDKDGQESSKAGAPIDIDSLSDDLKKKIKEYINSLPEDKQKELEDKAKKTIKDFEKELNEDLEGKLTENPEQREKRSIEDSKDTEDSSNNNDRIDNWYERESKRKEDQIESRKKIEEILESKEKDDYREVLEEVSDMIDALTADLRDVFTKRKIERYEAGYRSGRRWNVRKRIQEKIAGIPLLKTEAREQIESESEEMDYAITLMIDLSGSMRQNNKIQEAFKSAILVSETLENLGIKFEIVGFQDILLEFKSFDDDYSDTVREKMNQILLEVNDSNPDGHNNSQDNDDGKCLIDASENLAEQLPKNKFIIVLSDGKPAMDSGKKDDNQLDREMRNAVDHIANETSQKLIGIGILSDAVKKYYENNLPDVSTEELSEILGETIREIIENY